MLCVSHSLFGGNLGKFAMMEASVVINSLSTFISMYKGWRINFKLNFIVSYSSQDQHGEGLGDRLAGDRRKQFTAELTTQAVVAGQALYFFLMEEVIQAETSG